MSAKHPPPPRACIFCGAGKLSKEHVWSAWMMNLLPRSAGYEQFYGEGEPGGEPVQQWANDRQGTITNVRLRVVCKPCNNGWMNRVEEGSRAAITSLLQASPMLLTSDTRADLLNWITLKMMVMDASVRGNAAFLPAELTGFYVDRSVPTTMKVWLLRCGEYPWSTAFRTHSQSISQTFNRPDQLPNVKSFAFGLGEAFVFAAYQREMALFADFAQSSSAIQLWPDTEAEVQWPPVRRISAASAETIARSLGEMAKDPKIKWHDGRDPRP